LRTERPALEFSQAMGNRFGITKQGGEEYGGDQDGGRRMRGPNG